MLQLFDSGKRKRQKNPSNSPAMERARKINWALLQVSGAEGNLRNQMRELNSLMRSDKALADEYQFLYKQLEIAAEELFCASSIIKAFNERRKDERKQNGNRKS